MKVAFAVFLAAGVLLAPAAARASASAAIGGFTGSSSQSAGAAIMISSGAAIPAVPLEVQATYLAPLESGGGYSFTGEIRGFTGGGYGGAYVGAGAGIGNLTSGRSSGTVITAFAGKSIAPLTSIELRLYRQTGAAGATGGFIGLRMSL